MPATNRRQAARRGLRTIDIETVSPAILEFERAVGKSTEALRFHRSEPAKYLALGGRRPRLAPTRARADDGPGHDRDGPGRRRSRGPLRRAAARTPPAFSGGVTDFMARRAESVYCGANGRPQCFGEWQQANRPGPGPVVSLHKVSDESF